jgi:hypothetical protein
MKKFILWLFILGLIAMAGCGCTESHEVKIGDINNDPKAFLNRECVVKGIVTGVLDVPILKFDVFKIHDGTGEIWIFTRQGVPPKKIKVRVRGTFKTLINVDLPVEIEIGYYIELQDMKFIE